MYRILGSDGKEYGPVDAAELRRWIAARRVNAQTSVKAEGSAEWKTLADFPEFRDALAPAAPAAAPQMPPLPSAPASSGLATTSLVFGILSLVGCSVLTGIPAIIMGHIAHGKSRREPMRYGGAGMAMAGFILGYLSLLAIPVLAGLLLPALAKAKARAQTINCVSNMKQIGLAARLWAADHNETFPPDFLSMSNELSSPKILACSADTKVVKAMTWENVGPNNISYEYLTPGIKEGPAASSTVVFQCPIHGNVGYGDGSVQMGRPARRR